VEGDFLRLKVTVEQCGGGDGDDAPGSRDHP
jgi:hypothetical protein